MSGASDNSTITCTDTGDHERETKATSQNERNSSSSLVGSCPCLAFRTVHQIRQSLDSQEQTDKFVDWLSRKNDDVTTCQRDGQCPHRIGSALVVLNGIRDACRQHLKSSSSTIVSSADHHNRERLSSPPETYEEAFPSLLGGTKSPQRQASTASNKSNKPKRRIRPAPASIQTNNISVWSSPITPNGNISSLPSERPLTLRLDNNAAKGDKNNKTRWNKKTIAVKRMTPTLLTDNNPVLTSSATNNSSAWNNNFHSTSFPNSSAWEAPNSAPLDRNSSQFGTARSLVALDRQQARKAKPEQNENIVDAKVSPLVETPERKNNGSSMEKQRQRLVAIYTTILHRHLVPSTMLELHLLIRLLTVKSDAVNHRDQHSNPFSSVFPTGDSCRSFSVAALQRLKGVLRSLGFDAVDALAECPPLKEMLFDLTESLRSTAESMKRAALLFGVNSASVSQTPMLTLPFNQERDSRHNYRNRQASSLYKNREESRDAFLYQLRSFQNVRGRELDAIQADRSLQRIRFASRDVVQSIFPTNMSWFTQFFCDLLLQIGLIPMEETDKEILNITDKDKLQKLHRRFSLKEGKANKSSQKLVLETKNETASSTSPQPEQFFPGHQEFFYIFLQSADSYRFGVQLKQHLLGMLSSLAAGVDPKGLEQQLLKMQVLARFLGFLVFSPNWYEPQGVSSDKSKTLSSSSETAISHEILVHPVLPLDKYIKEALEERRLVTVVPWVVEFLRMIKWDRTSRNSSYYKHVLSLLRAIQEGIDIEESTTLTFERSNLLLVTFFLETVFSDIVGLGQTSSLPVVQLPKRKELADHDHEPLDTSPFVFSRYFLATSTSYLDELFALLSSLKDSKRKTATDTHVSPRKMRPYALRATTSGISSLDFSEAYSTEMKGSTAIDNPTLDELSPSRDDNRAVVQRKLSDAFFHQHKDLKEICDFVVHKTLTNMALVLPQRCIVPTVEKILLPAATGSPWAQSLLDKAENASVAESRRHLRDTLERSVRESIILLGPPGTHKRVMDVATKLSVDHAMQLGESVIRSLAREEVKKKEHDAIVRVGAEGTKTVGPGALPKCGTPFDEIVASLNKVAAVMVDHRKANVGCRLLLESVVDAKGRLGSWLESSSRCCEGSDESWTVNFTVTKLDPCGPCVAAYLELCLEPGRAEDTQWELVSEIIGLAVLMSKAKLCHRVLKNIVAFFSRDNQLEKLLLLGMKKSPGGAEGLGETLIEMLCGKLIDMVLLENALIHSLVELDPTGSVSLYCLEKLANTECSSAPFTDENSTIMPHLQDKLKVHDE